MLFSNSKGQCGKYFFVCPCLCLLHCKCLQPNYRQTETFFCYFYIKMSNFIVSSSKPLFPPSRLSVHPFVWCPFVRCLSVTKNFFRLNRLGITPDSRGRSLGLTLGSSGARSPSGGASKGPKGPF